MRTPIWRNRMSMEELNLNQNLRWRQARVFSCKKRFIIVVAGRRWGKTRLALWWLVVNAFSGQNRLCYYIAPNYRQAKRIAWGVLKNWSRSELDATPASKNCLSS